jgi:hypothetical protein
MSGPMTGPRVGVTIDSTDPAALLEFWCAALGYVVEPPPGGYPTWYAYWTEGLGIPPEELDDVDPEAGNSAIVDPEGVRPRIWFQPVPEAKVVKNRVHLDVAVGGDRSRPVEERRALIDEAVGRLVGLGGRVLRVNAPEGSNYYAVVMADPQGNEFCVA